MLLSELDYCNRPKGWMNRIVHAHILSMTSVVCHYYKIFRAIYKERDRESFVLNKEYYV